jgi:hypothetical protein
VIGLIGGVIAIAAAKKDNSEPASASIPNKEKAKPNTSKPPTGQTTEAQPKPPEKSGPLEVRIIVGIDGRDELRLTQFTAQWIHHSWQWPREVKMNSLDWAPQSTPLLGNAGVQRLVGKRVDDLRKVKLTKVRGRGTVTMNAEKEFITLRFDDDGALGADTYEVVLSFDK